MPWGWRALQSEPGMLPSLKLGPNWRPAGTWLATYHATSKLRISYKGGGEGAQTLARPGHGHPLEFHICHVCPFGGKEEYGAGCHLIYNHPTWGAQHQLHLLADPLPNSACPEAIPEHHQHALCPHGQPGANDPPHQKAGMGTGLCGATSPWGAVSVQELFNGSQANMKFKYRVKRKPAEITYKWMIPNKFARVQYNKSAQFPYVFNGINWLSNWFSLCSLSLYLDQFRLANTVFSSLIYQILNHPFSLTPMIASKLAICGLYSIYRCLLNILMVFICWCPWENITHFWNQDYFL